MLPTGRVLRNWIISYGRCKERKWRINQKITEQTHQRSVSSSFFQPTRLPPTTTQIWVNLCCAVNERKLRSDLPPPPFLEILNCQISVSVFRRPSNWTLCPSRALMSFGIGDTIGGKGSSKFPSSALFSALFGFSGVLTGVQVHQPYALTSALIQPHIIEHRLGLLWRKGMWGLWLRHLSIDRRILRARENKRLMCLPSWTELPVVLPLAITRAPFPPGGAMCGRCQQGLPGSSLLTTPHG